MQSGQEKKNQVLILRYGIGTFEQRPRTITRTKFIRRKKIKMPVVSKIAIIV